MSRSIQSPCYLDDPVASKHVSFVPIAFVSRNCVDLRSLMEASTTYITDKDLLVVCMQDVEHKMHPGVLHCNENDSVYAFRLIVS